MRTLLSSVGKDEPGRKSSVGGRARPKMGPQAHAAGRQLTLAQLRPAAALPPFLTARSRPGLLEAPAPPVALRRPGRTSAAGGLRPSDVPVDGTPSTMKPGHENRIFSQAAMSDD